MTAERKEYADLLETLSDDAFVAEVEMKVWLSAFASNNSRAPAHWQCDLCYEESRRREKTWLYKRGWNQAYISCGYELSDDDRKGAREPKE